MKHLGRKWEEIKRGIRGSRLYLFLDFDGTLVSIENRPENVRLRRSMKGILRRLAEKKTIVTGIISGRQLREIKKLIGIKGIIYAGNHGFEIEGPGVKYTAPVAAKTAGTMKKLAAKLKKAVRPFKGVIVEDKKITISIHYRMAEKGRIRQIEYAFEDVIRPFMDRGEIRVTAGKKVWEVRPPVEWDKGKTVLFLLKNRKPGAGKKTAVIYIGDDATDEDAFLALKNKGYTVKVGETGSGRSHAEYYLKNSGEVEKILRDLCDSMNKKG